MATNPYPEDGDEYDEPFVSLSWDAAAGAAEHDVYFGTDFDDVNDATASEPPVDPYKGRQTDDSYEVPVLEVNETDSTFYYWRIDEVNDADPNSPWKGKVWSFWLRPWQAQNPSPPDGAMYVDPNIILSWDAGFKATTHEVFFGTDPCSLPQIYKGGDPNCPVPGPLLKDTTYYWQINEWGPQGRRTLGPIWSFSTTLPTQGTILYEHWDSITPVSTTYDRSLDSLRDWPDYPANPTGTLELTLFEGPTNRAIDNYGARMRAWLYPPVTGDYKFWIATDDNGELWLSSDEDPANATMIATCGLAGVGWASSRNWADGDVYPSGLIPLVAGQKYYIEGLMKDGGGGDNIAVGWTTPFDNTIQVIPGNYLELFVQFRAWDPSPADGAPEAPRPITLKWKAGVYAAQHDVYFGTSEASMTFQDTLPLGTEEYDPPGTLDLGQTYYWKVNEVNMAEEPNTWEGDLWSFTVADYLVVDDMESYTDRLSIVTIWRDGYTCVDWGDPPNKPPVTGGSSGSNVSVSTTFAAPIYSGSQAMVFFYDNDTNCYVPGWDPYWSYPAPAYSEIAASTSGPNSLEITRNWTCAKALSLWFYGQSGNDATEQMYVVLEDGTESDGVVYYDGDMNDIKIEDWQQWNIDLQDFNDQGVDLADVNNIYIGFGDRDNPQEGGSGVVYFDDISLYPTRCVLSLRSDDFARVDFVEDCVVDYKEVKVMAENWLAVVPIQIDNPGFEDPVLADGTDSYSLDNQGWGYFDNAGEQGSWNPGLPGTTYPGYGGDAPEGQNVGWTNPGGVGVPGGFAQVLTDPDATLKADLTYTLTVEVGNTLGYLWGGYKVQLLAGGTPHTPGTGDDYTGPVTGGTLLAEDNNSLTIAVDTFETSTVTYTYNPAHSGLLGEPLQIRLLCLGDVSADDEADFDNVTLFRSPEPLTEIPRAAERRVDLYEDEKIDFKDFAVLADMFLDEQLVP